MKTFYYNKTADRLVLALFIAVALALIFTGCAAEEDPGAVDTYLEDIRIEATRTSSLNDRTEALLEGNEALQATAVAAYVDLGSDWAGLEAMRAELELVVDDLAFLLQNPVVDQQTVDDLLIQVNRLKSEFQSAITREDQQRQAGNADLAAQINRARIAADRAELAATKLESLYGSPDGTDICGSVLSVETLTAVSGIGLVLANRIRVAAGC